MKRQSQRFRQRAGETKAGRDGWDRETSDKHTDSERDTEPKRNPKSTGRDRGAAEQGETGQGGEAREVP